MTDDIRAELAELVRAVCHHVGRPVSPAEALAAVRVVVDRHADELTRELAGDPLLDSRQVAEMLGIELSTWRSLRQQRYAPKPDDLDEGTPVGLRRPKWRLSTVAKFQAARPGRGGRRAAT